MPLACYMCVDECVVFEDATVGVEASKIAGMYTVGLGPAECMGQADLVLPDLSGLTLHNLWQHSRWCTLEDNI